MPFDLASAKPADAGGFDLASAKPVTPEIAEKKTEPSIKPGVGGRTGSVEEAIAEPIMQMATGAIAKPVSDIAGLAAAGFEKSGFGPGGDPLAFKQDLQRGLTYEPRTAWGRTVAEYNPLALLGKAASATGERARGDIQGNAPADSLRGMIGSGVKEGFEQLPQLLGVGLGKRAEIGLPPKQAALSAERTANTVVDATRDAAQKAGYKTPAESGVKKVVADLGGRAREGKALTEVNSNNATMRLGKEVGAPEGAPLSKEVISNLKEEAYGKYDAMTAAAGPKLNPTPEFRAAFKNTLDQLNADIAVNKVANKDLIPARDLLKAVAEQKEFPTANTLRMIKRQRAAAKTDFRNGNTEMGTARLAVSEQLENLFQDNLAAIGQKGLVDAFKEARVNLAKLHLLDRIVNEGTGKVDLSKLASLSETKAYKGVLTGEFKTAADFAKAYRKAAQKPTAEGAAKLTAFDGMFAAGTLMASIAHPGALAVGAGELAARAGVPMAAERGWLQNRTPSYQPRAMSRALPTTLPAAGIGISQQAQQIPQPPQQQ